MKVLVVNWRDITHPEAGGAEIHIDEILKRKPQNWQVDFVSVRYKGCSPTEMINGYRVIRIPNNAFFNHTFKRHWRRSLRQNGYNLIIDDISKIPLATPRYIKNIPILSILHHIHGKSLFRQLFFLSALYVYLMERFFLRYYKQTPMMVVSESTQNELQSLYSFEKVQVCHNGVDIDLYQNRGVKKETAPTLLYLGRLKKYKRVDHIIYAFAKIREEFPQSRLIIAGKGDDYARLTRLTRDLNLTPYIQFKGFVDEPEKIRLLSSAWLYAITSEKEGWGISVIESNACSTPAIGYRVEGLQDSIQDSYSGFLVENGNITALADKIKDFFRDSSLRTRMEQNAREWATRFSWDNTAREFFRIAEDLVSSPKESKK